MGRIRLGIYAVRDGSVKEACSIHMELEIVFFANRSYGLDFGRRPGTAPVVIVGIFNTHERSRREMHVVAANGFRGVGLVV